MSRKFIKILVFSIFLGFLISFYAYDLHSFLTLDYLKASKTDLLGIYEQYPLMTVLAYFCLYTVVTALSIPGATALTLAGGAFFGFGIGLLVVSFASTFGASLAFLISRFFLRDYVHAKFPAKIKLINEGIEKQGALYLFSLRLVPAVPFFVINLAMGLTKMKLPTFFIVSQVGMLLGTMVYVNAGTQLAQVDSLKAIMSIDLIFSFALLGVFPLITKKILTRFKTRKIYSRFKSPKSFDYNLIVIGAGAAGLVSAYIASAVKAKVALIEKDAMGGDCLNTGCVPSKAFLKSASVLALRQKAKDYGLESIDIAFEFSSVMKRIKRVIRTIEPHDSAERYEKLGVECIKGKASLKSPFEVEVEGRTLTARSIIIATGASPIIPKIKGIEKVSYKTSETIWELEKCPERLLIMGGGPIGVELSQAFARFGSAVSLVEMNSQILPREDELVADLVRKNLLADGVEILTGYKGVEFKLNGTQQILVCETSQGLKQLAFDMILFAIGRQPNVTGFGLEQLGIELNTKGAIWVDSLLRTNIPNIYVCGDVLGDYQFTHVAAHEAWYASINALFSPFKTFSVDYSIIPAVTYSDPEVARVGLNEKEASSQGIPFEVTTYGIDDLDRAITDEQAKGFIKVLTVPGKDQIIGATIVGARAGELLAEFVLAMKYKLGLNKILSTIHAYPTFAEANKYVAGEWKRAHAPKFLLNLVSKFNAYRRG